MTATTRQPAIFLSHAGGPCFWMEFPPPYGRGAFDPLRKFFAGLLDTLPAAPRAIVLVSAHWEEDVTTVSTAVAPPMFFDYYGFPQNTYELKYSAPGSPGLALEIVELLTKAGIEHRVNATRGFDHGVFVPMLIVDPRGRIPVVMVSIRRDLDPARHIEIGRALAPLRDANVLVVGSGNVWHGGGGSEGALGSFKFEEWTTKILTGGDSESREQALLRWKTAPYARFAHPYEDHFMPLMVIAGAAGNDTGTRCFYDLIGGLSLACYAFS